MRLHLTLDLLPSPIVMHCPYMGRGKCEYLCHLIRFFLFSWPPWWYFPHLIRFQVDSSSGPLICRFYYEIFDLETGAPRLSLVGTLRALISLHATRDFVASSKSPMILEIPGPQDKRLTGNGEKLTYSCPAGCN